MNNEISRILQLRGGHGLNPQLHGGHGLHLQLHGGHGLHLGVHRHFTPPIF